MSGKGLRGITVVPLWADICYDIEGVIRSWLDQGG